MAGRTTAGDVIEIIFRALRRAEDARIDDVTRDGDRTNAEIILTTDDGDVKQCWVIAAKTIKETDVIL